MLVKINSAALLGLEAQLVEVEVDSQRGLPGQSIVGLPDASVKESRDRVRAALENSGFQFPPGYFTINLAPADIKKEGPLYDLPIAERGGKPMAGARGWVAGYRLQIETRDRGWKRGESGRSDE